MITEGTVAFASLKDHDVYQGKSTGKYTLTLTMSDSEAQKLEKEGVRVMSYEGNAQRKFCYQNIQLERKGALNLAGFDPTGFCYCRRLLIIQKELA